MDEMIEIELHTEARAVVTTQSAYQIKKAEMDELVDVKGMNPVDALALLIEKGVAKHVRMQRECDMEEPYRTRVDYESHAPDQVANKSRVEGDKASARGGLLMA